MRTNCLEFEIVVDRNQTGDYGLGLLERITENGERHIVISDVLRQPSVTEPLRIGDQIVSINDDPICKTDYRQVIDYFRYSSGNVKLRIHRCKPMRVIPNFVSEPHIAQRSALHGGSHEGFTGSRSGTHYSSGTGMSSSLSMVHLDRRTNDEVIGVELASRILIKSVEGGGRAEEAGLKSGDQLVSLNGINTAHLSLVDIASLLRRQETVMQVMRSESEQADFNSINGTGSAYLTSFDEHQRMIEQPQLNGQFDHQQHAQFSSLGDLRHAAPTNSNCMDNRATQYDDIRSGRNCSCPMISTCGLARLQNEPTNDVRSRPTYGSNDDLSSTPSTCTPTYPPKRVIQDNAERTSNKARQKPRKVIFCADQMKGTGLALVGGNVSGVYIAAVQSDSAADRAGIRIGDCIRKINGLNVDGWTKEEVALALIATDQPNVLELLEDHLAFSRLAGAEHESFFVRTYFSWKPTGQTTGILELEISDGDILHVTDTFVDGTFENWKATRIYPSQSNPGLIPNPQRAEQYVHPESSFHPPSPYERVIQLRNYPFPRPVVIYGPLAPLARQRLHCFGNTTSTTDVAIPVFRQPPVHASAPDATASVASAGLVRLSAIKNYMHNGIHCLLDINTSAINRLVLLGIPPIVILISPGTEKQLRQILHHYWKLDRRSVALHHPEKSISRIGDIKELSVTLWNEVLALRQFKSHLITDTVPINTENVRGLSFSEDDWIQNLLAVIEHQQTTTVWIGEESHMIEEVLQAEESSSEGTSMTECIAKLNENININSSSSTTLETGPNVSESRRVHQKKPMRTKSSLHSPNGVTTSMNLQPERKVPLKDDCNKRQPLKETRSVALHKCADTVLQHSHDPSFTSQPFTEGSSTVKLDSISVCIKSSSVVMKDGSLNHMNGCVDALDADTLSPCSSIVSDESVGLRLETRSTLSSLPFSTARDILAECAAEFGSHGGTLELPEYQVHLRVPQGALPEGCRVQRIFLRIYDNTKMLGVSQSCSPTLGSQRLLSPLIMCGPRGLKFRIPVELTLPKIKPFFDSDNETNSLPITLLHASADSTSTDEESSPVRSTHWHPIPLVEAKGDESRKRSEASAPSPTQGISSTLEHSRILILIDHF